MHTDLDFTKGQRGNRCKIVAMREWEWPDFFNQITTADMPATVQQLASAEIRKVVPDVIVHVAGHDFSGPDRKLIFLCESLVFLPVPDGAAWPVIYFSPRDVPSVPVILVPSVAGILVPYQPQADPPGQTWRDRPPML